jgi:hypothetical protein
MWGQCHKHCEYCLNQQWDYNEVPICHDYSPFDVVSITGGEPLLFPGAIQRLIRRIRIDSRAKIYVYTAKTDNLTGLMPVLNAADGLTVTLHGPEDVAPFLRLVEEAQRHRDVRSLRVGAFKGVELPEFLPGWQVERDKVPVRVNRYLPETETLMKWNGIQ